MPPIVSPQPRAVTSSCSESMTMLPMSSSLYLSQSRTVSPRATLGSSRLMSPILLADSSTSFISKSSSRSTSRRRSVLNHSQRRRRHCARADCRFDSITAPAFFDNLPWISALENSADQSSSWDIADLSEITLDQTRGPVVPSSGPGPVRRRKFLSRSRPLISEIDCIPDRLLSESAPLPFYDASGSFASRPRTPLSLIPPSRVRFHNLMPVFLDSNNDEHALRCNCTSPSPSPHHTLASS